MYLFSGHLVRQSEVSESKHQAFGGKIKATSSTGGSHRLKRISAGFLGFQYPVFIDLSAQFRDVYKPDSWTDDLRRSKALIET